MKIKYIRVSSEGQKTDRQKLNVDGFKVFEEQITGTSKFKERPETKEIIKLVESGEVTDLHVEELSRLGRNTADVMATIEWLMEYGVNIVIEDRGLQSIRNGEFDPMFEMFVTMMAGFNKMELDTLKKRIKQGIESYKAKNDDQWGRRKGTTENDAVFLSKPKSKEIISLLKLGTLSLRQIAGAAECSINTVQKVKRIANKHEKLKT